MASAVSLMPKRQRSPSASTSLRSSTRRKIFSLTPLEHIHLLGLFTEAEDRQMEAHRQELLQAIAANTPQWRSSDASHGDQPDSSQPTGGAELASYAQPVGGYSNRRASKRRRDGYEAGSSGSAMEDLSQALQPYVPQSSYPAMPDDTQVLAAMFRDLPPAQQVALLQTAGILPMPSATNHSSHSHQDPTWPQDTAGPSASYPNPDLPPTQEGAQPSQAEFGSSNPGPPSQSLPSTYSNAPPNHLSSGGSLSSGVDSYGHTLFSGQGSQESNVHSSVGSANVPGPAPSHSAASVLSGPTSASSRPARAKPKTSSKSWDVASLNTIVQYLAGPAAPLERLVIALNKTSTSPRSHRTLDPLWAEMASNGFRGERSPTSIATQWWGIYDIYTDLVAHLMAYECENQPIPALVDKIRSLAFENNRGGLLGKMPAEQFPSWTNDPENGWFALMHRRLKGVLTLPTPVDPTPQPVPAPTPAPAPAPARPIRRGGKPTRSEGSIPSRLSSSFVPTPPQPATATDSVVESISAAEIGTSGQWVVPQVPAGTTVLSGPALIEAVRDNNHLSNASADFHKAKAYYLRAHGLSIRVDSLDRITDILIKGKSQRALRALEMLESSAISQATRDLADATLREELRKQPDSIDVGEILTRLDSSGQMG